MGLTRPRAAQIYDIDYKQSVRAITTTNITLSGGAPTVVDGVTLSLNDRILVTGQSTASQNGIYTVSILGTGSNGTWARSTDTNATGELDSGTIVMVTEGSAYADTSWKLTTNDPIVIGTTALTFEINTGNAFGTISANGTSVVANSATGTVTFSTGNNIVITGNAATDTITFAVKDNPSFSQTVSATGNITGGNLTTVGTANIGTLAITGLTTLGGNTTIGGHVLPSANITYDLGSPTQRWRSMYVGANTIDIGGATISANLAAGSLVLTGPDGAEFLLTGTNTLNAVGHFGMIEISNTMSAHNTTTGALTVAGGAGIGGNVFAGGIIDVAGNSIYLGNLVLKDDGSNIFGLYAADGTTPATISQSSVDTTKISNGTSNVQVVSANANVSISVGGTSNVFVASTAGANVAGTLGVTGNITGSNLFGTLLTGTLATAAQPNVTSLGTLTSVSVTGNVTGGNANITSTTASTSKTTGALKVAGGIGVAGDVYAGNSVVVDGGAYGNVTTTQFASVFASGAGANPYSIMQVRSNDGTSGMGMQAYTGINGLIYSNSGLAFQTGATVRDKDYPTGGTTRATIDSTGLSVTGIANISGNVIGGNLVTTGAVSTETLITSGNATIAGNLTVSGNVISVNVTDLNVVDPIIGLGRGANDTPLTTNDGKDRGEQLWYYTTSEQSAFIGYDNSAGKLIAATNVSVSSEVVTVNNYGNLVVGGLESATISATGNANVGNLGTAGQIVASGNITGNYLLANITFASGYNTTKLFNGISEANIGTSGGNANISIGGVSNVAVFSTVGANISGTLGVTGNITSSGNILGGNILGNGYGLTGINSFGAIVVAGSDNVVADSPFDTLTLVAGDGVVITTSAGTDTITIATSGTGDSIFQGGGDMGSVTEAVTAEEDLGPIDEIIDTENELGTIVTAGVFYPDQIVIPSYTVAQLGNLSATPAGQMVYCSNESGGGVPAFSDGTYWRRVTDRAIVA